MAKKVVASLQKGGGKEHTKVIKMYKSEKTGSYAFKEEVVTFEAGWALLPNTKKTVSAWMMPMTWRGKNW